MNKSLVKDIQALEKEIDTLLADPENPFDTLPERVNAHQLKLAELIKSLNGAAPNAETLSLLQHAQSKIAQWTELAIEERDETRQTLLNLAQGRKARSNY